MKKIIPYILILSVLVGLFTPVFQTQAQATGTCTYPDGTTYPNTAQTDCTTPGVWTAGSAGPTQVENGNNGATSQTGNQSGVVTSQTTTTQQPQPVDESSALQKAVDDQSCIDLTHFDVGGCIVKASYYLLFALPAWILALTARLFNALAAISLSSKLYTSSTFISGAWGVVRDLSNIFFILILLYVAIKMILGLGGHDSKKMIGGVVLMALLINFSMFFTKVVIDSSNILALVFYNKIAVENADGTPIPSDSTFDQSKTGVTEKEIGGAIVSSFNPARLISPDMFQKTSHEITVPAETQLDATRRCLYLAPLIPLNPLLAKGCIPIPIPKPASVQTVEEPASTSFFLAIIFVSCAVFLFAAYAFFISAISFLSRLIELWLLIIFSPFAFMSLPVPLFSKIEGIGWSSWTSKLLKTAFMAPIFMFFLYLISRMIQVGIFKDISNSKQGVLGTILLIVIPAATVLVLLLKAASYAKKGGGAIAGAVIAGAKVIGGLAVGGVALGAAGLARSTVGATAKYVQNDNARRKDFATFGGYKNWSITKKLNPLAYAGQAIKTSQAAAAQGIHALGLGKIAQKQDKGFEEKTHATHVLDQKMQQEYGSTYGKDAKYKDLTEPEQAKVKKEVDKDEIAKLRFGKLFKDVGTREAGDIMHDYDHGTRILEDSAGDKIEATGVTKDPRTGAILTAFNPATGAAIAPAILSDQKVRSDIIEEHSKANVVIGEFVQALRKGTYDVRGLPDMSAKSKGILPKLAVGLPSTAASIMRLAIKKGAGIENYGAPQKDFLKDLKNTISDSLKNAKITIKSEGGKGGGDGHTEVKSVGH